MLVGRHFNPCLPTSIPRCLAVEEGLIEFRTSVPNREAETEGMGLRHLAVRVDTTDPVELWLIRLRPAARTRYLLALRAFLTFCGHGFYSVLQAAEQDRHQVHERLKAFIASMPSVWADRAFAYAAIRSYFSRNHASLPSDPGYEVGGERDRWWVG